MTKKILKFIILTVIIFIIIAISYVFIQYKPFIKEGSAFNITFENGKTHVVNNNFDINFDINKKCRLNSEPLNYISFKGIWLGNLICDNNKKVNIYIWSYDEELLTRRIKGNEYSGNKNILINRDSNRSFLTVVNNEKTKIFDLSTKKEDSDIFDGIAESLK